MSKHTVICPRCRREFHYDGKHRLPSACSCGHNFPEWQRVNPVWFRLLGLIVALLPMPIILLTVSRNSGSGGGSSTRGVVLLVLDLILSIAGSYAMVRSQKMGVVLSAVIALLLGLVIAAINLLVGALGGCIASGQSFP
jgi:hypothetical protein